MRVLVIGGGAAGVGAAWTLRKSGTEVVLVERNAELGGRGRTYFWEGDWRIRGAAAYVGGEPDMKDFAGELGLLARCPIVEVREEAEFEALHPKLGTIPIRLDPQQIWRSPAMSLTDRARLVAMLPHIQRLRGELASKPAGALPEYDNVTACDFFRRFSHTLVDYVVEPVIQQYFGYEERDYTIGWLLKLFGGKSGGAGGQLPWRFKEGGVGRSFQEAQLRFQADPLVRLRLETEAVSLDLKDDKVALAIRGARGDETLEADAAVVAVPGSAVTRLIGELDATRRSFLDTVEYVAHHVMHFIVERPAGALPESLLLPTAMSYRRVSNVWTHDHDQRHVHIHAEAKGGFGAETKDWSDEAILDASWEDVVRAVPALNGATVPARVLLRNDIGLCRRQIGHLTGQARFNALPPLPRAAFAGDYLDQSTLGAAFRTGRLAATGLLERLAQPAS